MIFHPSKAHERQHGPSREFIRQANPERLIFDRMVSENQRYDLIGFYAELSRIRQYLPTAHSYEPFVAKHNVRLIDAHTLSTPTKKQIMTANRYIQDAMYEHYDYFSQPWSGYVNDIFLDYENDAEKSGLLLVEFARDERLRDEQHLVHEAFDVAGIQLRSGGEKREHTMALGRVSFEITPEPEALVDFLGIVYDASPENIEFDSLI